MFNLRCYRPKYRDTSNLLNRRVVAYCFDREITKNVLKFLEEISSDPSGFISLRFSVFTKDTSVNAYTHLFSEVRQEYLSFVFKSIFAPLHSIHLKAFNEKRASNTLKYLSANCWTSLFGI